MAAEGNADSGGRSNADDRRQREIAVVDAGNVMQATMLATIKGEKGDGGSDRSSCGIAAGSNAT
ncbi:hypothetical protein B296_00004468, partial [Ensete ventricosum]